MDHSKRYAIVDLETTGGKAAKHRIIEIAIVIHDGQQIVDQWESLVDPECYIPAGITEITGITQDMVFGKPKFYEVARKVVDMTEGAIFVAHNVRFDYSFLREEFSRLGYTYTRKQLCTVRLSRQAFPGLPSYSLGKLARTLKVHNHARHRAMGDALTTARILGMILAREENQAAATAMINMGIREALLPKYWSLEKIHALPESCGVYYFHNDRGDVVYVGKSLNIKKRVAGHFADKTEKARRMQAAVYDLSYELTGSELVALLLESHEIKRLQPPINRAQRVRSFPYVIYTWINSNGFRCFGADKMPAKQRKGLTIIAEYPRLSNARRHLDVVKNRYELCANYCSGKRETRGPCFPYHLRQCHGACVHLETPADYNARAEQALQDLSVIFDRDFFILDQGRTPEEQSIVLIENQQYRGFGYVEAELLNSQDPLSLRDCIQPFQDNVETKRIIRRFLHKNPHVKQVTLNRR